MTVNYTIIGMLIGGLGLFLLAVSMITDGLKLAAGNALRDILARSTRTPAKGILTGIGITAIVQSSSAVTVATIGFVNAGLLSLYQALGVVYGANIGTTMTGWLVAIIGFKIKVEAFALPMIGIGMMLRLLKGGSRWGSVGTSLAGFGLFFVGIDVLKSAFEGMAGGIDLQQQSVLGVTGVLVYLAIGFLMTLFTQSSSAAIAIILTAATGGVLTLEAAAAMVIGANVGTTSTAGFAVIGATPNAKRVASAHVVFNLLTGLIALIILPVLFMVIKYAGQFLGMEDNPAVTLALFHTIFNILGVALMWPLSGKLSHFLLKRFRSTEEIESKPHYIDNTILVSPPLALNALYLELEHVAHVAQDMASMAMLRKDSTDKLIENKFVAVENLGKLINTFTVDIGQSALSEETSQQLPKVLYALQCYTTIAELAFNYARHEINIKPLADSKLTALINEYKQSAEEIIEIGRQKNPALLDEKQPDYHNLYRRLRSELLLAVTQRRLDIEMIGLLIDQIYRLDRIAKQMAKGTRLLTELSAITRVSSEPEDLPVEADELSETVY
ncbi:MAG: Na/Pi symporter [Gammaproteobacteria bacterium]|nr:Na/Pi symporter [Gammaproteobacteria bacterium]